MLKEALVKLLKVKSIISIVFVACFAYLSVTQKINTESFMEMFKLVIIFYFSAQVGKNEAKAELEEEKNEEENKEETEK